jgi:serine/threonine-protein kinase
LGWRGSAIRKPLGNPEIDGRADIYALGCVAYWLLTGRIVFEADNALTMIFNHVNTSPVPPSKRTELEIPLAFERLIMDCLEKDPDQRPSSIRVLINRLEAIRSIEPWSRDRADRWWQTHRPDIAANSFKDIQRIAKVPAHA